MGDKMEILNLQSSLQSEIQAKESMREELTQIRADFIAMQKELWEVKQQREEFARDVVRKDTQMKEMQQRLESGEGLKIPVFLGLTSCIWGIVVLLIRTFM